jgi:hypothetical protein
MPASSDLFSAPREEGIGWATLATCRRESKADAELGFDVLRGPLEPLLGILLIHRGMVIPWVLAAFDDGLHKLAKLAVRVLRVVNVSLGLGGCQRK